MKKNNFTVDKVKVKLLSRVWLFAIPWTVACTRLLHPWDFLGKSTGVGCRFPPQGIFPTQGSNPGLLHCRQTLYRLSHQFLRLCKINILIQVPVVMHFINNFSKTWTCIFVQRKCMCNIYLEVLYFSGSIQGSTLILHFSHKTWFSEAKLFLSSCVWTDLIERVLKLWERIVYQVTWEKRFMLQKKRQMLVALF